MSTKKANTEIMETTKIDNEVHEHVHGPNCNHGHQEVLKPLMRETPKVGRNDICPCGSQQKFKKCCGK